MNTSGFLLDSNIAIAILVNDSAALDFMDRLSHIATRHFYSTVTESEVFTGLRDFETTRAEAMFQPHRCLPVTSRIARRAATIRREQKRRGRKLKTPDALIIATALEHRLSLVSRDSDMFFVSVEYGLFRHLIQRNRKSPRHSEGFFY